MKLSIVILATLLTGSAYAQVSRSSTVTIYGKAAIYLWKYNNSNSLSFTNCEKGRRSPYFGTVECDLDVYAADEGNRGQVTIYGLAADELFSKVKDSPVKTGIHCFVDTMTNNKKVIGCDLNGFIIETEGL